MTTIIEGNKMIVEHEGVVFEASIVKIDFFRASEMLELNGLNRNPSQPVIDRYAREMLNDEWDFFAADPIRVNAQDEILDGQQRLMALVQAAQTNPDITLKTWLYWGIPTSSQSKMDSGRSRSAADQLVIDKMSNPGLRSSISSLLLRWENPALLFKNIPVTNHEVLTFARQNYDRLTRTVDQVRPLARVGVSPSIGGAVYFRAEEKEMWQASNFFTAVATGQNLAAGHPALLLRNTIMTNKRGNGRRLKRNEELYYVVRAWNAFRKEEKLHKLQLPAGGEAGLSTVHFIVR